MKLIYIIKNSDAYVRSYTIKFRRALLKKLARNCQNGCFYLQSSMDISERSLWNNKVFTDETGGFFPKDSSVNRVIVNIDVWDTTRRDMLILFLRTLTERNVQGLFAELGVYKGWTAKLIHNYCPERTLHLFDTFEGFTERSVLEEESHTGDSISSSHFSDTSLEAVKKYISSTNENIEYHKGYFPDSLPESLVEEKFAFVHLDADLYEPIYKGLEFFYPRMSEHGIIVIHDYNAWLGSRKAVDQYCLENNIMCLPMPDKSGSAVIIKG